MSGRRHAQKTRGQKEARDDITLAIFCFVGAVLYGIAAVNWFAWEEYWLAGTFTGICLGCLGVTELMLRSARDWQDRDDEYE